LDRQIILDTETTGLNAASGDRIIEIGCVEMINRRVTGRTFHTYLNPEREIDDGATAVHGFRLEDLLDKPKFAEVQAQFAEFVDGAELVIHNAPFDIGFLDAEYRLLDYPDFLKTSGCTRIDTLRMAKELHPGKRNSLDSLCERYGIPNTHRTLHGALLDARLLADVYLALTRGQDSLSIGLEVDTGPSHQAVDLSGLPLPMFQADAAALAAHEAYLDTLDKEAKTGSVWRAKPQPDSQTDSAPA
jgi:DNA polymerase III subunit epsilon